MSGIWLKSSKNKSKSSGQRNSSINKKEVTPNITLLSTGETGKSVYKIYNTGKVQEQKEVKER